MFDEATGDAIEAYADAVERITEVEIGYIDWMIEQDGKFENGDWELRVSRCCWSPVGDRGPLRNAEPDVECRRNSDDLWDRFGIASR